jgi:MFS family permease
LLWAVLCLNVTAGIGVLGMASPMIQEISGGRVAASAAAGFLGLLSVFNIGGRIFWASLSDVLGRRLTFSVFFILGIALYGSVPFAGSLGNVPIFVGIFCVIITMYGGGFATIPAYLADLFGTGHVSAIHGRLLTAWSTAGVLGPVLVNYIREFQIAAGVAAAESYNITMYVLAGLLAVGLIANVLIRRVDPSLFTMPSGVVPASTAARSAAVSGEGAGGSWGLIALTWIAVLLPIGWGVMTTLRLTAQMFR